MYENTIQSRIAFQGRLLKLEQLDIRMENGGMSYREIVRHPGGIAVVARLSRDRFVLVRQYRKPVEAILTEVVAGLLNPGEDPEAAARRELEEETGYAARRIVHLGTLYPSPGYVDEKLELFLADLDPERKAQNLDHGERVVPVEWTREQWATAIRTSEVRDAKTVAAWAMLLEYERAHEAGA